MKASFLIFLLSFIYNLSYSQSNVDPIQAVTDFPGSKTSSTISRSHISHSDEPPLIVIFFKNKMLKTSVFPETLPSEAIKSVNILKSSVQTKNYGKEEARNGVVEIILNDQKHPKANKLITTDSRWRRMKKDEYKLHLLNLTKHQEQLELLGFH